MTAPNDSSDRFTFLKLISSKPYLNWMIGDTAIALGNGLLFFALPLLALEITGNAASAGLVGGFTAVGGIIGLLPGGVLADRCDRPRI